MAARPTSAIRDQHPSGDYGNEDAFISGIFLMLKAALTRGSSPRMPDILTSTCSSRCGTALLDASAPRSRGPPDNSKGPTTMNQLARTPRRVRGAMSIRQAAYTMGVPPSAVHRAIRIGNLRLARKSPALAVQECDVARLLGDAR